MQVLQWAGPIPMGRRGGPGLSAMSGGWSHGTDYFLGPAPVFAGGSSLPHRAKTVTIVR